MPREERQEAEMEVHVAEDAIDVKGGEEGVGGEEDTSDDEEEPDIGDEMDEVERQL